MSENTIYSVCGMCGVRCPIEVGVEGGQCRSIQGNRHAAGIRGALCVRGAAGVACVQDDERCARHFWLGISARSYRPA